MVAFLLTTLLALILIALSLRRVQDYERMVLLRLGKPVGIKGPGWIFVFPGIDKILRVEMEPPPVGKAHSQGLIPMEEADRTLAQALVKRQGLTDSEVDKSRGVVVVDGIRWKCFSPGWIQSAAPVVVIGVERLRLKVTRLGE
jgi:hypothetical protein